MLTQETKRKIDSARQILVGKVPDPKAQIDQITTALIYKFMDDMDKDAMELGGKARFFTNGFEKYAWSKILDSKLGGHDRLELYAEAITKLWQNNHLPQLFRDIFKDAFLPYRSPETLSLFLKEINGFTYNHSEDLGDAFEYLLSIMSSQGDAGQFRTPRHIIDFITEVVDPKKDESILDPACGTAGFLISAYKHILKQHDGKDDPDRKEKPLTPDDKKKLMNNLVGYDISPDMVKLSKVNMYLHGFAEPKIYEYDTLSSDEKWDEMYDVIMANPPFMSPKGGIRPHKRFSVQANRAEVLFVDYIKEHLRPNGRAGVIVPEGIIFQSGTAYKQLRKLLVEDGLFAAVSLPSGVFNPYSGVKTSILFLDNQLAKQSDSILFVKVDSDGFDLGAQRRETGRSDLPLALMLIDSYKRNIASQNLPKTDELEELSKNTISIFVPKSKIRELGDYYLTGDRYKEINQIKNQKYAMVELDKVCTFEYGKPLKAENRSNGKYPVFGSNGIVGWHNEYLVEGPLIVVGRKGTAGAVTFSEKSGYPIDTTFYVRLLDNTKIDLKFLYFILRQSGLDKVNTQAGVPGLNRNDAYKIKIPLPPLEVQKEIVEQIEVKQNAIDAAKKVIENLQRERSYFGRELTRLEGVDWIELGTVCKFVRGPFGGSLKKEIFVNDGVAVYEQSHAIYGNFTKFRYFIKPSKFEEMKRFKVNSGDLIMSCSGTMGKTSIIPENAPEGIINQALLKLTTTEKLNVKFLKYWMDSNYFQEMISQNVGGAAIQNVASVKVLSAIKIPLPSLKIQKQLIAEVEKEEEIMAANYCLIELMEVKISNLLEDL